jgi:hypothetical protein
LQTSLLKRCMSQTCHNRTFRLHSGKMPSSKEESPGRCRPRAFHSSAFHGYHTRISLGCTVSLRKAATIRCGKTHLSFLIARLGRASSSPLRIQSNTAPPVTAAWSGVTPPVIGSQDRRRRVTASTEGPASLRRPESACRLCAAKVVSEVIQSLHLMPPTSKRALRRRAEEAPLHVIIALMLTDY